MFVYLSVRQVFALLRSIKLLIKGWVRLDWDAAARPDSSRMPQYELSSYGWTWLIWLRPTKVGSSSCVWLESDQAFHELVPSRMGSMKWECLLWSLFFFYTLSLIDWQDLINFNSTNLCSCKVHKHNIVLNFAPYKFINLNLISN